MVTVRGLNQHAAGMLMRPGCVLPGTVARAVRGQEGRRLVSSSPAFDLDPLLADLAAHGLVFLAPLGADPDPLHRDRLLRDHRPLLMQNDLLLVLTDLSTRRRPDRAQ
jgi:hypothetical protein